jgi:hypothetical protein
MTCIVFVKIQYNDVSCYLSISVAQTDREFRIHFIPRRFLMFGGQLRQVPTNRFQGFLEYWRKETPGTA